MANNNFEQITEYFDAYVAKAKGVVSLKSFIEENSDIIDKFSRGEDVDVRRFWNSKFTELVTERGIKNFRKDQPDWDAVRSPLKKPLPKSRKRASSSSSISSATASSSSSSPSSLPPQCESSNSNSVKSSTESTTKRRKKITIALTEHVEPVVLHESTDKWVVGEVPVTEKLLEYRDLSIEKGKEGMLDAYQEEMSINGIFLIDGLESVYPSSSLEYGFDEQTWELMVEECNGRYPVEELSDSVIKALSQFEKAAHKNLNSCSAIADKVDSTFIKESLINIISAYSPDASKIIDANESTFSIVAVYPVVLPFTKGTMKTNKKGQAQGSADLRFSDLSINFAYSGLREQGLLITEIKPPHKIRTGSRPDLVKLANEMKASIDKMVEDGCDDKDISVFGLLIEGFRCTLFGMDLIYQATYRLVPISVFFLPQDHHDFIRLPNCYAALTTMRSLVLANADRCFAFHRLKKRITLRADYIVRSYTPPKSKRQESSKESTSTH